MLSEKNTKTRNLEAELEELRHQLYEANETIEAIRMGQVDALVVQQEDGNQLYTLKTADQLYRIFIEKMAEGAVTLGTEGIILFCNSQFAAMLGLTITDILGKPFRKFVGAAHEAEFNALFRGSWKAEQKSELQLQSKETTIPVQLSLSSLTLENETIISIIITNLTTQKATQAQLEKTNLLLEKANKALESSNHDLLQFASVASHDMQEPLRKMHVLLSHITDRDQDNLSERTAHDIQRVMQAASRMRNMVIDVLNYSRLTSDIEAYTTIQLDEVVNEVIEDLELMISEKNAILDLTPLPVVQGNRGQIRQVIQNLVMNALKFSRPGTPPKIYISGTYVPMLSFDASPSNQGPYALLRIKDEGIGFDEKYAGKIFSLFTRLHSKDQYEGTGIGLAITKRVIEGHGGLITVRSRENVGTEFRILLPVTQTTEKN